MKYSLALEGGGSKGSYHAGAIRALEEMNITIEAVVGTSIGSINGAYYIQEGSDQLSQYWKNMKPKFLIPSKYEAFTEVLEEGKTKNFKELMHEMKDIISNGGINLTAFKNTLYASIDEDKVRNSHINFGLVTYSLTELKAVEVMINEIPKGKLIEYLIASSYLPGFKREKLNGKSYIDGAFYDNLPLNLLIRNGYKKIIAIELLGMGLKKRVKATNVEIIYISPSDDIGKLLSFDQATFDRNMQMGYCDTKRVFENLFGKWFYIRDLWTAEKAYAFINDLSEGQIEGIAEMMNIKLIPHKRCLFEKIIPKLMELVSIPEDADYNVILLYMLEYIGKKFDIDRYQILTIDEFIKLIRAQLKKTSGEEELIDWNESIIKLLKTTKLYSHTFKDELIIGCAQIIMTGKN